MHKIIYYSTAVKKMSDGELNDLLTKSRIFNKSKNITGILLYLDGDFDENTVLSIIPNNSTTKIFDENNQFLF